MSSLTSSQRKEIEEALQCIEQGALLMATQILQDLLDGNDGGAGWANSYFGGQLSDFSRERRERDLEPDFEKNPRKRSKGKRKAAANPQAELAMKLYHSGKAATLADAWDMVKGSTIRANSGQRRR